MDDLRYGRAVLGADDEVVCRIFGVGHGDIVCVRVLVLECISVGVGERVGVAVVLHGGARKVLSRYGAGATE